MTNQKSNEFIQKIARMATSATHTFEEKNKLPVLPVTGVITMTVQLSTFIAALFLTFLAIVLTIITTIYTNLKEM